MSCTLGRGEIEDGDERILRSSVTVDVQLDSPRIDESLLVDPNSLFIGSKIGEGAHGKVYAGRCGDQIIAIKVLHRGSTTNEKASLESRFIREVNMMSRVKHDNLVKFIGACKDPLMVIVTELLPGMSLRKYLAGIRPNKLDLRQALNFALDIARAMDCLHSNGIIHRDLKPDNLLLTANHKSVKLADFGLAREESVEEMMTAETGTYRWMAPELYSTVTLRQGEKKHYNNKVDVYSFGIVLWELLTNRMPFEGMSNLQAAYAAAFKQERPSIPGDISPDVAFIIQSCWVEDPNMRPSFSQVIRMLNSFLFTLPPPSPSSTISEPDANEAAATSNGTIAGLSPRARGKFAFLRQLFTAKKTKNSMRGNMLKVNILGWINSRLRHLSSVKELEQHQALVTKAGLQKNVPVVSKLIAFAALSPFGSLAHAQALFEDTAMDDPFICNTMIRAYSKSAFPFRAIHIYNRMQNIDILSDNYTFNFVLKACAMVLWCTQKDANFESLNIASKASEIHCRIMKLGFSCDEHIQNSLIHLYSQCGFLNSARRVFDEMTERTITSWNIMVSAYDMINDFESSDFLISTIPGKNVVSFNSLIRRYVRLGDIEAAKRVFREMPERDAVSWNTLIGGNIQIKDYDGALNLFREMQTENGEPTEITLISIIGACAETSALHEGRKIHESLKRNGYKIEGYLGIALVDMYAKCGDLLCAWEVFNQLKMKPVSCWNAMIVGLAVHGYSDEALKLFAEMNIVPNRVTFIGVLLACSHNGLVEEGRIYFKRMVEEYEIQPDMKHFGCMVDMLSRWGSVNEAYEMIKGMPFDANAVLWRTLLGACKVHGNDELAKECFEQLLEMDAVRDCDYILLSNLYAESERWEDVERLRNIMSAKKVPKQAGFSHVQMK